MSSYSYSSAQTKQGVPWLQIGAGIVGVFLLGTLIGARMAGGTTAKKSKQETAAVTAVTGMAAFDAAQASPQGAVQAATGFLTAIPEMVAADPKVANKDIQHLSYLGTDSNVQQQLVDAVTSGKGSLTSLATFKVVPVLYKLGDIADSQGQTNVRVIVVNFVIDRGHHTMTSKWATHDIGLKRQFSSWKIYSWTISEGPVVDGNNASAAEIEQIAQGLADSKGYTYVAS